MNIPEETIAKTPTASLGTGDGSAEIGDAPPVPSPESRASPPAPAAEDIAALKQQLEQSNKRLEDTRTAFRHGQRRLVEMERLMAQVEREKARPALLDETEGLQEAIRYVTEAERQKPTEEDHWIATVSRAIPDVSELMNDVDFKARAYAERARVGETEWRDPLTAIRALSEVRAEILKTQALAEDRKARGTLAAKTEAMEIPGGAATQGSREAPVDEAERIRAMSHEDFVKMRDKVLGYSS